MAKNATYGTSRSELYDDGDDGMIGRLVLGLEGVLTNGSCDPRQPDGSGVLHPEAVNDGRRPSMLAAIEAAQQATAR